MTKSGSSIKLEYKQQTSRNTNNDSNQRQNSDLMYKTQSISATFESCLHTSTSFCDGGSKKMSEMQGAMNNSDSGDNLELYNNSPQQYRKFSCYNSNPTTCSPDILSSKMFVELDLVASVQNASSTVESSPKIIKEPATMTYPMIVVTSDDYGANSLPEKKLVQSSASTIVERTQPDGHEKCVIVATELKESLPSNSTSTTSTSDNLDGMLDRISHDLDYLLNGKEEMIEATTTATIRRARATSRLGIIHQIEEEDDDSVAEANAQNIANTNC